MNNAFTLAGLSFTLKKVRYGIHSDETVDYTADLYCGKELIARVSNDGQGGMTRADLNVKNIDFARKVEETVRKEVRFTCQDGTKIHYYLGDVADEALILHEREKEINRLQKKALVLEGPGTDGFMLRKYKAPVPDIAAQMPQVIKRDVAESRRRGYTVLNTNIPEELLK